MRCSYGLRPHVSIASLPGMAERTIVVNGFSKSYAMTGWRLGYACGPEPIIKIMTKIHQSAIMSAPTTSQYAAITALRDCDGEIDRMRDEYNMRRRLVVRSFNDMGLTCFEPRGAFYAFPALRSDRHEQPGVLHEAAGAEACGHHVPTAYVVRSDAYGPGRTVLVGPVPFRYPYRTRNVRYGYGNVPYPYRGTRVGTRY